ncbi:uncharacterized protein MELLADRAFT_59040 [Melampsora larici-populina 98AG31]|uniref:F-box domain-containing protein n=1 Tax=Melampsora larici-populina (strain 98AG31 / pathotype 3-4-7) TaxID=747676 RepID=F4R6U7_MELLP|nr:uncharacterized protein MELLADRAFT_59040 [Melampsora larici-populina 98AG31]EGG12392.1 hypothetical protein MELLADRAFT_59040 [Melampsora larici-populina 98AG31]
MPKGSDESDFKTDRGALPYEIITRILADFWGLLDNKDSTSPSAQLLGLRLVSKAWSTAIISTYFVYIHLHHAKRAKTLLDNWTDALYAPGLLCPVKRLRIDNLWYAEAGLEAECDTEEVLMDQALILDFTYSMGAPPSMVKAVKALKALNELHITHPGSCSRTIWEHPGGGSCTEGIYDLKSLGKLLSAVSQIKSLKLEHNDLEGLRLKPNALPNLKHFRFTTHPENIEGLTHICETAKNSLKCVQVFSDGHQEDIDPIFEPIKDSLEACFTAFLDQFSRSALEMEFPKLRILGTQHPPRGVGSGLNWLNWPMLQNVRTLFMLDFLTRDYWKGILKSAEVNAFEKVPNLKHIILANSIRKIDPQIVEAFKSRGIQCHFTPMLSPEEVMEWDSKLHNPLNGPA